MHSVGLATARGRHLARDGLPIHLTSQLRRGLDFKNVRSNSLRNWLDNLSNDEFAEAQLG